MAATPVNTDLLADTDLFIRKVAEYAESKLTGSTRVAVANAADYRTNASGDIVVPFPALGSSITGAVLYVSGGNFVAGKTTKIPPNPPGTIDYIVPNMPAFLSMLSFNPGGGAAVWARVFVGSYHVSSSNPTRYIGSQPAASNALVNVAGIAWGPA